MRSQAVARAEARDGEAAARLRGAAERSPTTLLTVVACALAAHWGWRHRESLALTPETGLGYALGVAGLSMMAVLLLYSLRKRLPALRGWGPLRHWFSVHMLLGVVGPTAILFHANFEVHSLNAKVAMIAMTIVAASGFFGRFIYTRVHHGLFGERQTLREVASEAEQSRAPLRTALASFAAADDLVREFEASVLGVQPGYLRAALRTLGLGLRQRSVLRSARRLLRSSDGGRVSLAQQQATQLLRAHLRAVRRVAAFEFWERTFSVWHALHFPLTVALFSAAAIHVIAVHVY